MNIHEIHNVSRSSFQNINIDFYIDIHAHSTLTNGIYVHCHINNDITMTLSPILSSQGSCMAMCMTRRRDLRDKPSSPNCSQHMLKTSHWYNIHSLTHNTPLLLLGLHRTFFRQEIQEL